MFRVTTSCRFAPKGDGGGPSVSGAMSSFKHDQRGNVAMTFGLMVFIMIGFMGASVDIGRWLLARKQTQEAIDGAVLAGLRSYQSGNMTLGDAKTTAEKVALVNYKYAIQKSGRGEYGVSPLIKSDNIAFTMTNNNTQMTATGVVEIKTPFIAIATQAFKGASTGSNISTLPVLKTNGTENAIAKMQQGQNSGTNLEISVMIDITGSMGGSDNSGSTKIETVKKAATSMVDILVWNDQSTYTSKVAVVPFSETVNLGSSSLADQARGAYAAGTSTTAGSENFQTKDGNNGNNCSGNNGNGNGGNGNNGNGNNNCQTYPISNTCVTERIGSEKYTDASPSSSPVGRYYSTYGKSNGTGICPTASVVLPLSNDKVALKALIGSLSAGGSTAGHIGTAWAWYMLSPNFNTLWGSTSQAAPYSDLTALTAKGKPKLRKIAVLMTDGDYNTEYCNGVNLSCTPTNDWSQAQALALCSAMKTKGIEVYTIGSQVSNASKAFLTSCATDASHFYDATDGNKLQQAFIDIAYKLVPPYIAH